MKTIDKSPALVCLPLLLAVHGFMTLACAQDTTSPPASGPLVSPEFCPAMNQQTNPAVTARLVKLAAQGSSSRPCLVLFNSQSKQVLVGCATNRTCLLNGSFFQVDPGQQGFFVTMSRPLGADQLTEQKAIELSRQAFQAEPSSRLHLEPGTRVHRPQGTTETRTRTRPCKSAHPLAGQRKCGRKQPIGELRLGDWAPGDGHAGSPAQRPLDCPLWLQEMMGQGAAARITGPKEFASM